MHYRLCLFLLLLFLPLVSACAAPLPVVQPKDAALPRWLVHDSSDLLAQLPLNLPILAVPPAPDAATLAAWRE
ncbi:hypothetical protein HC891_25740, partial [Candidatus Gracilibacteria bacterium]|nr:hypothetical protein [Candidatus Gracilibacteria bacterium]